MIPALEGWCYGKVNVFPYPSALPMYFFRALQIVTKLNFDCLYISRLSSLAGKYLEVETISVE